MTNPIPGLVACLTALLVACGGSAKERASSRGTERHRLVVNGATLLGHDAFAVIEPVFWSVNIYDGPATYEMTLARFSLVQRHLLAVHWYRAEVDNGGHDQFYSNSTGIVWRDALAAFRAMDLGRFAAILEESAKRLGGAPSLEREARQVALERHEPDFSDLDKRFYALEQSENLDHRLLEYARAHARDVFFDGEIEEPARRGK